MAEDLTKALLVEEVVAPSAIAEALLLSVRRGVPLTQALVDSGATTPEVLSRYLARSEAPYLRQVAPVPELVDRLPTGLCARLLAVPVRHDAITGTIDVAVADAGDPHPPAELAFHLDAPVRVIRAPLGAIEEALRRLRARARSDAPVRRPSPPPSPPDEPLYDSRPRSAEASPANLAREEPPSASSFALPRPAARARGSIRPMTGAAALDGATERPPPLEPFPEVQPSPSDPPLDLSTRRRNTPTWGTPVHSSRAAPGTEPPKSGLGSEIPIPLTRRAFAAVSGGTQRPPPLVNPSASPLGEGYPIDPGELRSVVELSRSGAPDAQARADGRAFDPRHAASFIPGPPPLPVALGAPRVPADLAAAPTGGRDVSTFAAFAPQMPLADVGAVIAALRGAGSRDEVLELLLTGARAVAARVALFVVKRGGYLGWACTPEFAERRALQSVLIPLDSRSVFDTAVREDVYLGPIRNDEVHASLLSAMRTASRDVALVPVRVSGKTAVIIVADDLGDTMVGTRRLEQLAGAAGEAFGRIVRGRR